MRRDDCIDVGGRGKKGYGSIEQSKRRMRVGFKAKKRKWTFRRLRCLPLAWPLGARVASRRRWGAPWSCRLLDRRLCRQDEGQRRRPRLRLRLRLRTIEVMPRWALTRALTRRHEAEEDSRRPAGAAARQRGPADAAAVDAAEAGDGRTAPAQAAAGAQKPRTPASTTACMGCGSGYGAAAIGDAGLRRWMRRAEADGTRPACASRETAG